MNDVHQDLSSSDLPYRPKETRLWPTGIRWLSPIFGGILGFLYSVAAGSGAIYGWYWSELSGRQPEAFSPGVPAALAMWGIGAAVGGTVASLFAEAAFLLAVAIVPLGLAASDMRLVQVPAFNATMLLVVLLVGSVLGGLVGRSLRRSLNEPRAPAGIWWPHWLYFIVIAYYLPVYLIQTATNIWIDLKLLFYFLTHPKTWFWWRAWVYWLFFSWFAGVPTSIILHGYDRLYDVMRLDSEYGPRKKFNAFFMYFLTVPAIAWFLTFGWRWAVARLFAGTY